MIKEIDTKRMKMFGDIANTLNKSEIGKRLEFEIGWDMNYTAPYPKNYYCQDIVGLVCNVKFKRHLLPSEIEPILDTVKSTHIIELIYWMDFTEGKLCFVEIAFYKEMLRRIDEMAEADAKKKAKEKKEEEVKNAREKQN